MHNMLSASPSPSLPSFPCSVAILFSPLSTRFGSESRVSSSRCTSQGNLFLIRRPRKVSSCSVTDVSRERTSRWTHLLTHDFNLTQVTTVYKSLIKHKRQSIRDNNDKSRRSYTPPRSLPRFQIISLHTDLSLIKKARRNEQRLGRKFLRGSMFITRWWFRGISINLIPPVITSAILIRLSWKKERNWSEIHACLLKYLTL